MKTRSYDGKVAAITGAASGMGRTLALALAERGCEVAISDVDEVGLAETAAAVRGARVSTQRLDVSDGDAVRAWAAEVVERHGRVNLVFNNAGIAYGGTVRGMPEAGLKRVLDVDFWGVVHGTQAFLPHLEASGDGHVVNTSSLFGLIGFPANGAYCAAKFAVRGYTETLAIELETTGSPVRATCVHPGGIKTNIARAARVDASVAELGIDTSSVRDFERAFRVTAERAAEVILHGVARNQRRVLIGADARLLDLVQRFVPGSYQGLVVRAAARALRAGK